MLGGALVVIFILAPFSWLALTSFMHEREALTVPPQWIPKNATLDNYRTFFFPSGTRAVVGSRAAEQTLPSMVNSLIAAGGTALINVLLGSLAGYSLARIQFPAQTSLLLLYVGSRMVPGVALIVPLYLTIKTYGLLDNVAALIITYLTFTLPFTIWLLKNYFQSIPRDLKKRRSSTAAPGPKCWCACSCRSRHWLGCGGHVCVHDGGMTICSQSFSRARSLPRHCPWSWRASQRT
jgi:multiple sugar transport system permease protein